MDGSRGAVDLGFEKGGFKIPDTVYLRHCMGHWGSGSYEAYCLVIIQLRDHLRESHKETHAALQGILILIYLIVD